MEVRWPLSKPLTSTKEPTMMNFKTTVLAAALAWGAAGAQAGSIHDTFSDGAMLI